MTADVIRIMSWEFTLPGAFAGGALDAAQARASEAPMDNEAFAVFYQRSARPLWAYLVRVSTDPALAEDLMQESYVRFLCAANAPSLESDGETAARLYLFRIASNLLHDHWRRPRPASIEEIPEEFFAASGSAAQSDSQMLLGPAFRQMKRRERQLLWLAHAEGYSHREIAEVTGLARASIRLLLFRARRKIAALLRAGRAENRRRS
ncbi:MAG: sigma-70 family RNA polymerase sigma factor [Terracidiphilus sp.]